MTRIRPAPKLERLRELFDYDPYAGTFLRRSQRAQARAGDIAGTVGKQGYVLVGMDYCQYGAHRLAWLYVFGEWPVGVIDHINGNRSDNRLCNLRDVDRATNTQNQRKAQTRSRSGVMGAYLAANGKWLACINVNNKKVHLGSFKTAEEAHAAYIAAKRELHPGSTL